MVGLRVSHPPVFMTEALQTNDVGYISHALGVVARAKGMAQIASQTGLSREQLYRSFSARAIRR